MVVVTGYLSSFNSGSIQLCGDHDQDDDDCDDDGACASAAASAVADFWQTAQLSILLYIYASIR